MMFMRIGPFTRLLMSLCILTGTTLSQAQSQSPLPGNTPGHTSGNTPAPLTRRVTGNTFGNATGQTANTPQRTTRSTPGQFSPRGQLQPSNAYNQARTATPQNQNANSAQRIAVGKRVYPKGSGATLVIEKHAPVDVRPNQAFSYRIRVINPTQEMMRNVVVRETQPTVFRMASSVPQAQAIKGAKQWKLGNIPAGAMREIQVNGTVTGKTDKLISCVTVTHDVTGCWAIGVTEPKLQLTQTIPPQNMICDQIPIKLTLSNTGTGTARGIRVFAQLPQGLQTLDGQTALVVNGGDIPAGQSRQLAFKVKATSPTAYTLTTNARSAGGLSDKATSKFKVGQPQLTITKKAPKKQLIGRKIKYRITVTNKSSVTARDVAVRDQVPPGVRIAGASTGGQLNKSTNEVLWKIGTLKPKESRKVSLLLIADKPSTVINTATASAYCAPTVKTSAQTKVSGIPAILLEVVDIEDPIEVGENMTYLITVTNQGSATGTNIRIECDLESSMQYVSSAGATMGTPTERKVIFDPLPRLKPKAKASWKLIVRAVQVADARFTVKMTSDQIGRQVLETEATNFYE